MMTKPWQTACWAYAELGFYHQTESEWPCPSVLQWSVLAKPCRFAHLPVEFLYSLLGWWFPWWTLAVGFPTVSLFSWFSRFVRPLLHRPWLKLYILKYLVMSNVYDPKNIQRTQICVSKHEPYVSKHFLLWYNVEILNDFGITKLTYETFYIF